MAAFKKIPGYSLYEISENGEIRKIVSKEMISQRVHPVYGYKMCDLLDDNLKVHTVYPHKEVARTYMPLKKDVKMYVIHINGNPKDNKLKNLKWATPAEAQLHQVKMGMRKRIGNPELYKYSKFWLAKQKNKGKSKDKAVKAKDKKVLTIKGKGKKAAVKNIGLQKSTPVAKKTAAVKGKAVLKSKAVAKKKSLNVKKNANKIIKAKSGSKNVALAKPKAKAIVKSGAKKKQAPKAAVKASASKKPVAKKVVAKKVVAKKVVAKKAAAKVTTKKAPVKAQAKKVIKKAETGKKALAKNISKSEKKNSTAKAAVIKNNKMAGSSTIKKVPSKLLKANNEAKVERTEKRKRIKYKKVISTAGKKA